MLTGCFKNLTLFKKISNFFQKSLDFSIFLYYNQLTSRPEFQQWTGQSRSNWWANVLTSLEFGIYTAGVWDFEFSALNLFRICDLGFGILIKGEENGFNFNCCNFFFCLHYCL